MKIDYAKRREVMERSMRLGHCICDPRRSCPCDVFHHQGICPCAGERPDPLDASQVRLTKLVRNPGCASKIAPADLQRVLKRLPEVKDPAVLSGLAAADDAAIYRIRDDLCLVQTVDVFTPCVDDARLFGQICAANCLSDVYAMGGEPRTALSILAFPSETLDGELMRLMLTGAMEKLEEAGVALVGGHSVKDEEIKLGFAITGTIDPAVATGLERAHPGDLLVLTKPLGTGVLAFAAQVGRGHTRGMAAAAQSMATLNRDAAAAMRRAGASACTDITGFGLLGHLLRLAQQSGVTAEISAQTLPSFEGVMEALRSGVVPGAVERNREFVGSDLEVLPGVDEAWVHLGCDAQTSGGLLIAIDPGRLETLTQQLETCDIPCFTIGRILGTSAGRIVLSPVKAVGPSQPPAVAAANASVAFASGPLPTDNPPSSMEPNVTPGQSHEAASCCSEGAHVDPAQSTAAESQRGFGQMLRAVQAHGALDPRTKELILLSLVIHSRCAACFDVHYQQARHLGITDPEIDEAAWCAIAMGGAPVRMFYQECLAHLRHGGTSSGRRP